jgi:hypothetical protein
MKRSTDMSTMQRPAEAQYPAQKNRSDARLFCAGDVKLIVADAGALTAGSLGHARSFTWAARTRAGSS